jgi:hypothetical protein
MPRLAFALLFSAAVLTGRAQTTGGGLVGHVEGDTYVAASGSYRVKIPVRAEMGGIITDTANVVTFRDDYNVLYSIGAFRMDSSERWKLSLALRGDSTPVLTQVTPAGAPAAPREASAKDYLYGFFTDYVLPDFKRAFPGVQVENSASFLPHLFDGTLVVYTLLPGGSMFAGKVASLDPDRKPPVAKRGNMLFVKDNFVYVISTELAERVTEGTAYALTPAEENVRLREKLMDIVNVMKFLPPPPAP